MRSLLQFTLDLFEAEPAQAPRPAGPGASVPNLKEKSHHPSVAGSLSAIDSEVVRGLVPPASAPVAFVHPRASREVALAGVRVAYAFQRGKRRTIGFSVGPDGLAVRAPSWVPLYEVDAALREKADWILRKLGEARERQGRLDATRIEWRDGAEITYFGERLRLVLDPRHNFRGAGAQLLTPAPGQPGEPADGVRSLQVSLPHSAGPQQIRDAVQAWLMRQAHGCFVARLDHFAPQLGVQWKKLSLSNAATRWGSARADGSIRLNWRLVHFRLPVIDYVVVHELSHLRVMDHSPRFWDTVQSVVPDYAALRGQLRDEAPPRW